MFATWKFDNADAGIALDCELEFRVASPGYPSNREQPGEAPILEIIGCIVLNGWFTDQEPHSNMQLDARARWAFADWIMRKLDKGSFEFDEALEACQKTIGVTQ